jgi:hypothetical protein
MVILYNRKKNVAATSVDVLHINAFVHIKGISAGVSN